MAKRSKPELGVVDSSSLTDADWAEINRLTRAYEAGGQKAFSKAFDELSQNDPVRCTRVVGAFFPGMTREAIKDEMAERGVTLEDLRKLIEKQKSRAKRC